MTPNLELRVFSTLDLWHIFCWMIARIVAAAFQLNRHAFVALLAKNTLPCEVTHIRSQHRGILSLA
jgi:hypothetical protein